MDFWTPAQLQCQDTEGSGDAASILQKKTSSEELGVWDLAKITQDHTSILLASPAARETHHWEQSMGIESHLEGSFVERLGGQVL